MKNREYELKNHEEDDATQIRYKEEESNENQIRNRNALIEIALIPCQAKLQL